MNPVEEQKAVISKLANLIHCSVVDGYEEAACKFIYEAFADGSASVDSEVWFVLDGNRVSASLVGDKNSKPIILVPTLHRLMRSHTGGKWVEFTLTLDKEGKATTKFKYPE